MATKKMTQAYWIGLGEGTKRRALTCVFPLHPAVVDMLSNERPKLSDPWWRIVFSKVRIPEETSHYHFVINHTYYM